MYLFSLCADISFLLSAHIPSYWYHNSIIRTVAHIDDGTKVVHSASITIFPFKPRDFVTVVHFRQLRDGTRLVLNR